MKQNAYQNEQNKNKCVRFAPSAESSAVCVVYFIWFYMTAFYNKQSTLLFNMI